MGAAGIRCRPGAGECRPDADTGGDRIGLHPVAVIFALMAGGQLAGFVGVVVALPVAAVIAVFLRHALGHYRASDIYGGNW